MRFHVAGLLFAVLLLVGFAAAQPANSPPPERIANVPHLPNAFRIHDRVISGGLPDGKQGFAELQALGVRTVVSVDGARPDVELAKTYGLKYVHLPHGYDGISRERALELAKVVRDMPGPVYIHCHHGKHRSPAAAAAGCVTAGLVPSSAAVGILKTAGTNPQYRGLYEAAAQAVAAPPQSLTELKAEFPEIAKLPPLAEAMVEIEHRFDALKKLEAAGWKAADQANGGTAVQQALLLQELYKELLRQEDIQREPAGFRKHLREGEQATTALHAALEKSQFAEAATALKVVNKNCVACHATYRDQPRKKPLR